MAVSKWGVLDRHDAETYPTDLTLPRWRWEFLRRSGAYRQDWERVQADPEAVDPRKYGLSIFLNPASSIRCPTPDCTGWSDDDFLLTPAPPEGQALTISLTFDLTKDLNKQFERARHLCAGLQATGSKGTPIISVKCTAQTVLDNDEYTTNTWQSSQ